jgi:hypothetical protein
MSRSVGAPRYWPGFWVAFRARVPGDAAWTCAYELFNFFRDRNPRVVAREVVKAFYHGWNLCMKRVPWPPVQSGVDYCFVIDSAGVPGLSSSLPLLAALPPRSKAVIVTRGIVLAASRLGEFGDRVTIVDADRVRSRAWSITSLLEDVMRLFRAFPSGWPTIPQLVFRRNRYQAVMDQVIVRFGVSIMIVTNERLMLSACAIHAAKQAGVFSCCLQHGALVEEYLPVQVDCYMTWGSSSAEWLRRRNVGAQTCVVGAPRVDRVAGYIECAHRRPARSGRPIVCFFTQPATMDFPQHYHERVAKEICEASRRSDLEMWIKLHPADSQDRWRGALGGNLDNVRILDGRADTYELIAGADYSGSFYSTVLIEAMMFPRPVFQLNPFRGEVPDYCEQGGAMHVSCAEELSGWIHECEASRAYVEAQLERQRLHSGKYFANVGSAAPSFFAAAHEQRRQYEAVRGKSRKDGEPR